MFNEKRVGWGLVKYLTSRRGRVPSLLWPVSSVRCGPHSHKICWYWLYGASPIGTFSDQSCHMFRDVSFSWFLVYLCLTTYVRRSWLAVLCVTSRSTLCLWKTNDMRAMRHRFGTCLDGWFVYVARNGYLCETSVWIIKTLLESSVKMRYGFAGLLLYLTSWRHTKRVETQFTSTRSHPERRTVNCCVVRFYLKSSTQRIVRHNNVPASISLVVFLPSPSLIGARRGFVVLGTLLFVYIKYNKSL